MLVAHVRLQGGKVRDPKTRTKRARIRRALAVSANAALLVVLLSARADAANWTNENNFTVALSVQTLFAVKWIINIPSNATGTSWALLGVPRINVNSVEDVSCPT